MPSESLSDMAHPKLTSRLRMSEYAIIVKDLNPIEQRWHSCKVQRNIRIRSKDLYAYDKLVHLTLRMYTQRIKLLPTMITDDIK